jgi:DDE superfamily endonuclease
VLDVIESRFARYEPLRHAASLMAGMLPPLERKNCWTIAEHRGGLTPEGLQHLLSRARWDADLVRDDLRGYVLGAFADEQAVLIVDETGEVKKGIETVGVQRQYTGTAGRIENAQVAVYLTYAAGRGHAMIDRALYVPRSWTGDVERRDRAGVPDELEFATKPALATAMIRRAVAAGTPAAWVAGDEVYGADPTLRKTVRELGLGYVLQVAANRRIRTHAGPTRVDAVAALLADSSWQTYSCGRGAKGHRDYAWAWIGLLPEPGEEDSAQLASIICSSAAAAPAASWAYLRCWTPRLPRWPNSSASPGSAGASRNPSKPPRAWSVSTSTRSDAGRPGIAGPPSRCSPTPSLPSPPPSNANAARHRTA